MDGHIYLQNLNKQISELSNCPLKSFAFSLTNIEIPGESIDCLRRFFLERSDSHSSIDVYLILETCKRFKEEDLKACLLERFSEESQVIDYRAEAVMKNLFETFKMVCADTLQTYPNKIIQEKFSKKYHTNCYAVKNKRRKMEDRHVLYEDLNSLFGLEAPFHQSFYAVFDGHGGTDAANYASSQLVNNLVASPDLITDACKALKDAILKTDTDFVRKAERERLRSGATAVTVLLQGKNLTVGWLGDSQVVLSKNGEAIQLMEPHKPDREDERARIEALGGCVVCFGGWRVNGTLAVSRAIGDFEQKPFVTGEADVEEFVLEGDEEFLILACDGLWDTVDPCSAVSTVCDCMKEDKRDDAAESLVELAKLNRSLDNITVMVVYLDSNLSLNNNISAAACKESNHETLIESKEKLDTHSTPSDPEENN